VAALLTWLAEHAAQLGPGALALIASLRSMAKARAMREEAAARAIEAVADELGRLRLELEDSRMAERACQSRADRLEAQVASLRRELEDVRRSLTAGGVYRVTPPEGTPRGGA